MWGLEAIQVIACCKAYGVYTRVCISKNHDSCSTCLNVASALICTRSSLGFLVKMMYRAPRGAVAIDLARGGVHGVCVRFRCALVAASTNHRLAS